MRQPQYKISKTVPRINNLREKVTTKLFADDIKIYLEIDNNAQTTILQKYVDGVMYWAVEWGLMLSHIKCQHMCVTLRKSDSAERHSCVLSCIDLRVCVDSSLLSWKCYRVGRP